MTNNERRQLLMGKYKNSRQMNVSDIRFTQRSVNDTFSNGTPIKWTIHMLQTKQVKPCEIPLIRVGFFNGYYKSVDNRRLYCYKSCNIKKIPVIVMETITKEFKCKDQSPNNGVSVQVIHDPKPPSSHTNTVTAFHPITWKCRSWTVKEIIARTQRIGNVAIQKVTKTRKPKTYFCEICDSTMSLNDKPWHLSGQRHQFNTLEPSNAMKSTTSKPPIYTTNHASRQRSKSPKVQNVPKSTQPKTYFCEMCDRTMSFKDKSGHLGGRGHQLNVFPSKALKSTASKSQIYITNHGNRQRSKPPKVQKGPKATQSNTNDNQLMWIRRPKQAPYMRTKMTQSSPEIEIDWANIDILSWENRYWAQNNAAKDGIGHKTTSRKIQNVKSSVSKTNKAEKREEKEAEETQYISPKIALDSVQFEYEEKLSQKTKEIKHLEIKLDAERSKCELLSMHNTKLQQQLSIKSDNNECNEGLMCNMSTVIDYLKRRVSQQELELKKYKQTEYEESSNITIDLGVSQLEADIVGLSIFSCCKKRKE